MKKSFANMLKTFQSEYPEVYKLVEFDSDLMKHVYNPSYLDSDLITLFDLLDELNLVEHRGVCQLALSKKMNFVIPSLLIGLPHLSTVLENFSSTIRDKVDEKILICALQELDSSITMLWDGSPEPASIGNGNAFAKKLDDASMITLKNHLSNLVAYAGCLSDEHYEDSRDGASLCAYFQEVVNRLKSTIDAIEACQEKFKQAVDVLNIIQAHAPIINGFITALSTKKY